VEERPKNCRSIRIEASLLGTNLTCMVNLAS